MNIHVFDDVAAFLNKIPPEDSAKILAHLKSLEENRTEGIIVKPLKGTIKEIVVQQYRIVFFRIAGTGYVVDAFKKQSRKTPKRIIERAERIHKDITK